MSKSEFDKRAAYQLNVVRQELDVLALDLREAFNFHETGRGAALDVLNIVGPLYTKGEFRRAIQTGLAKDPEANTIFFDFLGAALGAWGGRTRFAVSTCSSNEGEMTYRLSELKFLSGEVRDFEDFDDPLVLIDNISEKYCYHIGRAYGDLVEEQKAFFKMRAARLVGDTNVTSKAGGQFTADM